MMISEDMDIFRDDAGRVCAHVHRGGRLDVLYVEQQEFEDWLVRRYLEESGAIPKPGMINGMVKAVRAKGREEEKRETYVRFAAPTPDEVYIDLANDEGEVVRVSADSWDIVRNPDLPFRRPGGMRPLPHPERGGSLSDLRPLLNAHDERTWTLLVGFLVSTLLPTGTMPVLVLQGEQGSLKSTTSRMLRSVVDPQKAPLRRMSGSERDLMVAAGNAHILGFDNVSELGGRLSDAICSLASGGGYATRRLYTDRDETIIEARRPIILNGIAGIVKRDDLADRALQLTLPPVSQKKRRSAQAVQAEFEDVHAGVLGSLLDAAGCALRRRSQIGLDRQPRLADFNRWMQAAEPALPWPEGQFEESLRTNRQETRIEAIETNPLARAVVAVVEGSTSWEGTATALLQELERRVPPCERSRHADWPASPSWVWRRLRRVRPLLRRAAGIKLSRSRSSERRTIRISRRLDGNDASDSKKLLPS